MWKYKFYQTVDCVVTGFMMDGKEAIELSVLRPDGDLQPIGKAKLDKAQQDGLPFHSVVEVRHRGLSKPLEEGGRLIEPVFQRRRPDKPGYQCDGSELRVRGQRDTSWSEAAWEEEVQAKIGISRQDILNLLEVSYED
jgi:hypothetical protein